MEEKFELKKFDIYEQVVVESKKYIKTIFLNEIYNEDGKLCIFFTKDTFSVCIVFRTQFHGIAPSLLQLGNSHVCIGYGTRVHVIDIELSKVLINIELVAPFYEFLAIEIFDIVLIISELTLYAISTKKNYKILWEVFTNDILIDYNIENDRVITKSEDGEIMSINLMSGFVSIINNGRYN